MKKDMFRFGLDDINTNINDKKFTMAIAASTRLEVVGTLNIDEYMIAIMSGYSNNDLKDLSIENIKRDEIEISNLLKEIEEIKEKIKGKRKSIRVSKKRYKSITGSKYE